uniref:ANK_REP_REGION domain-containing protein n=1 Tax=Glossina pallidipes TaxID=7398 RepID=A0A1A9ZQS3_GLOPL
MAQKRDEKIRSKKVEKQLSEEQELPEITLAHPKAKKWIVAMATANYEELAKLASDWPELVKLRDPATGYSALHWAAKHGNEDMVNLIAGTYKADVNGRTNGGYTPLHIAMQFDRSNVFHMLSNDYKANLDLLDWAGNKALDYSKQKRSVSASPYSNEYCPNFVLDELDTDYHFKLPSNIRNLATNIKRSLERGTLGRTSMRSEERCQLNANSRLTRTQSLRTSFPSNSMLSLAGNEENLQPCWLPIPNISPARDDLLSEDAHTEGTRVESLTPRSKNFLRKTIRAATALF